MNRLLSRTRTLLFLFLLMLVPSALRASGPFILPEGKGFIHIYGGAGRTGNYFNINGTIKPFDSLETAFTATLFGVSFDYGLLSGLELNIDVPIGYFRVSSVSKFPDRSIFSPVYYGIGATYQLTNNGFFSSISSMLKIPPGFHRGIYDDPAHPSFLSDGYFQLTTGLNLGYAAPEVWIKGGVAYNWRDEEPLDEIVYQAEIGFSRVEGTGIFVGTNGVISTGDVTQPLRPFYVGASGSPEDLGRLDGGRGRLSTIDRETYLAITAGAFVYVTDNLMLDGRYTLRLFGQNSLNLPGAFIGAGYRF
jgi:hypothetical protein